MVNLKLKMALSETNGVPLYVHLPHYGSLDRYAAQARGVWEWTCEWNKGATELTAKSREGGTIILKVVPPDLQG